MTAATQSKETKEIRIPSEQKADIAFTASNKPVDRAQADCAWVGLFSTSTGVELTMPVRVIDKVSGGAISRLLKAGDFDAKAGSTLLLRDLQGIPSTRVLLVGCGPKEGFTEKVYADAVRAATKAMTGLKGVKRVSSYLTELPVGDRGGEWKLQTHILACREVVYRFDRFKTKKEGSKTDEPKASSKPAAKPSRPEGPSLQAVEVLLPGDMRPTDAPRVITEAQAIANGIELTKDLGNLPPNLCTPTHLANTARALGRQFRLKVEVLDKPAIEKLGMNALLAVSQGSAQPPQFIVIHHSGGTAKDAPVVVVGKGITFDTGGISLKPPADMDQMKYDMSGAGTVLGVMHAAAEMGLKRNVIGVIPTCENMPSGTATRPGDIVQTMSGQTVEILNTDAEGRLILCDALTYVEREFKPEAVIDVATLTGACVIALGHVNSGLFTSDDGLAEALLKAGKDALDFAWRLPLQDDYQEQLKSPFADMANVGGRSAGSITAACFLWRFAKSYKWAHLDIAGTAWNSGTPKGATGRPVGLLLQYLRNGV
ncbi:MAG: leucyl aminopeptidase [Burkholderiaceae bacterium]